MTAAARAIRRWMRTELHLADHVVEHWRSYVLPLCLSSLGLMYWISPLDLVRDPRFYIGYSDELGFLMAGLIAARVAVERTWRRRAVPMLQEHGPSRRFGERSRETLINSGLIVLKPYAVRPTDHQRTVIVSGVARGGTSMAAQIVRQAGIPLGESADDIVAEDVEFSAALSSIHLGPLRRLIARRNGQHCVWGLKVTNIFAYLAPWDIELFRNPRMILVIRDPIAIAQRNVVSMCGEPQGKVAEAFQDIARLGQFAQRIAAPTLLVSCEKALAKPDQTVRAIIGFCGVDQADRCEPGGSAVRPENEAYLLATSLVELPPPPERIRQRIARALVPRFSGIRVEPPSRRSRPPGGA